jgi:hypothetical protein
MLCDQSVLSFIGSMHSTSDLSCIERVFVAACLLSHMQSRQVRHCSAARAQPHLHSAAFSRDDESIVLVVPVDSDLPGLCVEIEAQVVTTRLTKFRRAGPIVARAASDSSEAVDTRVQRKINAVGSTLVHDVEEQPHVVFIGVVVGGEVAALGDVHALVVGAETLQSVFGEGDLDGCRGVATDYASDACARAKPACAGADGNRTGAWDHRLGGILC